MDFFYLEQKLYQYKKWLQEVRGDYTNKDMIVDMVQTFIILLQAAIILL